MKTVWNDEEDGALQGLPWLAQLLYLRCLRPYMDYASGIVGIKRGVSYQGMAETLYREPGQGKHEHGSPSLMALRHALTLLERAGLLRRIAADRRLIFELVLADRDDSASEKWNRRATDVQQTKRNTAIIITDNDLDDDGNRRATDPNPEKCNTPPISDIRKSITPEVAIEREPKNARGARLSLTVLPDDWQQWAKSARPDLDTDATWQMFRDHWLATPGARGCKADWLATWRNWVRREHTSPGGHNGNRYESTLDRRARINGALIDAGQRAFDEMGRRPDGPLRGDLAEGVGG